MHNRKQWTTWKTSFEFQWKVLFDLQAKTYSLTCGWGESHATESFPIISKALSRFGHQGWKKADPSTGGKTGRSSSVSTHPSIALHILSTTEQQYGRHQPCAECFIFLGFQPWLSCWQHEAPLLSHLKDIIYMFILNIGRWSTALALVLSQLDWSEHPQHLSRSLTKIENQKDLGAILV